MQSPTLSTRPTTTTRDGRRGYDDLIPDLDQLAGTEPGTPGRDALREYVIREFRPLVRNLSRRFAAPGRGVEDIEQAGMLGLVKAVDRYDPSSATGGPLGYLVPSIRGEMKRHLRDYSWAVRVPRDLKELAVTVGRVADELGQRLGRPPRPSEIATEVGVPIGEVVDALGALESHHAKSLDAPVGDDGSGEGLSLAERMGSEDPALDLAAHGPGMRAALNELPERERRMLVLRFYGDRTQSQIATELGISQMHVSRLLSRTLARLRERLADD
ncbi:SigB/SigF/SigG family RNA polymerase sigma factor [Pseudonocardia alni]|jgi:RNA polymerase sigma-B factor|uniref:RNA polymerase sigma-B factor n=1 Tax=Pseudonocardia alni TaxID=33907 RepID=A0AA44UMC6_PSEA5|nr:MULTISPECIES: SigB/SigF/SigG family RNA polymerase sigma factor [Pseudonocardia]MYW74259.1 SigB/SigF/SigG family RNA polymerase sigma factor [Pseudonocardia sp. SID8383]OJG08281.1 RNA polymerase sigma factor SigF [Pseudonocardia autotrophica]PKB30017.1 RNA polymerase sigma-B factor [Pseudonocardia alni]